MERNADRTITNMTGLEISIFLLYRRQQSLGGPTRDRLPYTDAFDRLLENFNRENSLNYSHNQLWTLLDLTLKAGENYIIGYLNLQNIQLD